MLLVTLSHRELAHTEGEDGGRRRGGSSGLKMKKIGAVIKKVMGEEKCGDGRGGEATCVVVEARPYVSKQEVFSPFSCAFFFFFFCCFVLFCFC